MSSVNLEAALELLRDVPPLAPERQAAARRRFLEEAARLGQRPGIGPAGFRPAVRPTRADALGGSSSIGVWRILRRGLVAAAGILLLYGLLAGLVYAGQLASPTSPLYSVKLAWEDVRLALTWEPRARADLALDLVDMRVGEIADLAETGEPVPPRALERLEHLLRLELSTAARLGDPQMVAALERVQERTQVWVRTMEQAWQDGSPRNRESLQMAVRLLNQVRERARLGLSDQDAFRQAGGWVTLPQPIPTETSPLRPAPTTPPYPTPSSRPTFSPIPVTTAPAVGPGRSPEATQAAGSGPGQAATPHRTSGQAQTAGPDQTTGPAQTPGPQHTSEPGHNKNGQGK